MSFISNLFKKKAGGTFFGNLIRSATGGLTGAPPTQYDIDKKELSDSDFALKYGTDKRGVPVASQTTQQAEAAAAAQSAVGEKWYQKKTFKTIAAIVGGLGVVALIVWAIRRRKTKRRY